VKSDRLLFILGHLQMNGRATARELSRLLEVSKRTIHRDMETLAMAGIPVYAERGYRGGWSLPEGYRNKLTGLTSEEISSLLLIGSSGAVTDLGLAASAQTALRKLLAALPETVRHDAEIARQRIHIDGAGWRAPAAGAAADPAILTIVQQAVWESRKLRIRYQAARAEAAKERVVSPLGLIVKMSVWYVAALVEEDVRSYRVSRIVEAEALADTFERPPRFDLAAWWEASMAEFRAALPRYPALVRIAADHWPQFRQERYVHVQGEPRPAAKERWICAEVEFNTLESACSIMLYYGRHAEAIGPAPFREAVRSELLAASKLYES